MAKTAAQPDAAQVEQICDYSVGFDGFCQVRTNVPLATDQKGPAYQVDAGYRDGKRVEETVSSNR
jgi:hypothetical protein